jgi:Holliday junction resolvase RusA-like endonuclease
MDKFSGFTCTIPGKPISWKRVGGLLHRYDTQKQEKLAIGLLLRKAMANNPPLTGPLEIYASFNFIAPKKYKCTSCEKFYHITKPDADNCLKFIMDCCTDANVWLDDSQVSEINVSKRYTFTTHEPYTHLTIRKIF